MLEELAVNRKQLVRPERFELPTCCSGGNRSIQLSYGRTGIIYSLHGAQSSSNRAVIGSTTGKLTADVGSLTAASLPFRMTSSGTGERRMMLMSRSAEA